MSLYTRTRPCHLGLVWWDNSRVFSSILSLMLQMFVSYTSQDLWSLAEWFSHSFRLSGLHLHRFDDLNHQPFDARPRVEIQSCSSFYWYSFFLFVSPESPLLLQEGMQIYLPVLQSFREVHSFSSSFSQLSSERFTIFSSSFFSFCQRDPQFSPPAFSAFVREIYNFHL